MSFLTEYFDEYREHPMRKAVMCRPENRWAKLEGKWLDPSSDTQDKSWTDEEVQAFIKATMRRLRGQSTYYNDYCSHLAPEFKTRPFKPRQKRRVCKTTTVEDEALVEYPRLAIQDTELMKVAQVLYEGEEKATLRPLPTHTRIHGYCRQRNYCDGPERVPGRHNTHR
ncbi:hypothetical protein ACJJTC_019414, partial [Scirpophaga incertulas]